ncbi:hypothetical protein [Georgenia satyanarayanai]|uniref:hypothetical protein n=1 Tax=Georgenia satyanarayanai TaxID=860221 RepID=UPI0012651E9F|nr:hypothetical protein [Georgenia satyanarayanai]
MDGPLVLTQRQPRWMLVALAVFTAVVVVMAVAVVREDPRRLLSFVPTVGFIVFAAAVVLRPPRVELHEDVLVVRGVRTTRIPYTDITAVRGDVPSRLDWSTHLLVERREGRPVTLSAVDVPLAEVHDLIARRAGLG